MKLALVLLPLAAAACRSATAPASAFSKERPAPQVIDGAASAIESLDAGVGDAPASEMDAAVQARVSCPEGTSVQTDTFPYAEGHKHGQIEWCVRANGQKHGPWLAWFEDGAPETQGAYEDDDKHGLWVEYFLGGGVYHEERFDHGKKHGLWRTFWGGGDLAREETFDHDKCVGTVTYYGVQNKVSERGQCVDGQLHGDWISYSPSGKKTRIIRYDHGTPVKQFELRKGKLVRVPVEGVPPDEPPEPPVDDP